mmetsp:Transcript_13856/g.27376  ORF Transcript_13856/g.27376 Transcript_13856/m.27376 type:complete len:221 (+) Transcript_13856:220-882(+)
MYTFFDIQKRFSISNSVALSTEYPLVSQSHELQCEPHVSHSCLEVSVGSHSNRSLYHESSRPKTSVSPVSARVSTKWKKLSSRIDESCRLESSVPGSPMFSPPMSESWSVPPSPRYRLLSPRAWSGSSLLAGPPPCHSSLLYPAKAPAVVPLRRGCMLPTAFWHNPRYITPGVQQLALAAGSPPPHISAVAASTTTQVPLLPRAAARPHPRRAPSESMAE